MPEDKAEKIKSVRQTYKMFLIMGIIMFALIIARILFAFKPEHILIPVAALFLIMFLAENRHSEANHLELSTQVDELKEELRKLQKQ